MILCLHVRYEKLKFMGSERAVHTAAISNIFPDKPIQINRIFQQFDMLSQRSYVMMILTPYKEHKTVYKTSNIFNTHAHLRECLLKVTEHILSIK